MQSILSQRIPFYLQVIAMGCLLLACGTGTTPQSSMSPLGELEFDPGEGSDQFPHLHGITIGFGATLHVQNIQDQGDFYSSEVQLDAVQYLPELGGRRVKAVNMIFANVGWGYYSSVGSLEQFYHPSYRFFELRDFGDTDGHSLRFPLQVQKSFAQVNELTTAFFNDHLLPEVYCLFAIIELEDEETGDISVFLLVIEDVEMDFS